jgi:hypothetical protein
MIIKSINFVLIIYYVTNEICEIRGKKIDKCTEIRVIREIRGKKEMYNEIRERKDDKKSVE